MRSRMACGVWCALLGSVALACGSDSEPAEGAAGGTGGGGAGGTAGASAGGGEAGATGGEAGAGGTGGAAMPLADAVRTSCGDLPILDDRWRETSDACKACVDTACCAEAQACADSTACKSLWECRASCDSSIGSCLDTCNEVTFPPENSAFIRCRNACKPCIDVETCRAGAWPAPAEPSYPIAMTFTSYTASTVVFPGITVKVCEPADVECSSPVSEGVTDALGAVTLDVPSSPSYTDAYIEITGPNVLPNRIFMSFFHAQEELEAGVLTFGVLDSATGDALRGAMGATADQTTVALVSVQGRSCGDRGLAGMTVSSTGADASTIQQYLVGPAPSPDATMTDGSGYGMFADHPAGPTTVSIADAETSEVLGSRDVTVRAGFMNTIIVNPSP